MRLFHLREKFALGDSFLVVSKDTQTALDKINSFPGSPYIKDVDSLPADWVFTSYDIDEVIYVAPQENTMISPEEYLRTQHELSTEDDRKAVRFTYEETLRMITTYSQSVAYELETLTVALDVATDYLPDLEDDLREYIEMGDDFDFAKTLVDAIDRARN